MHASITSTNMKVTPKSDKLFGLIMLVLTVLISIGWQSSAPLHSDDYYYRKMPGADAQTSMWKYQGDEISSFSQVPQAWANHYQEINGRLSNMVYLALQPLPVAVIKIICGLMLAVFAFMLWQWCGAVPNRNNAVSLAVPILLWTGFPWENLFQSSDYHFNYVAPAILMILCLRVFLKQDEKPKLGAWMLLAVFSLWHEGYSICLGFFLAVQWIFNRQHKLLFAIIILIAGTFLQLSPGLLARAETYSSFSSIRNISWTLMATGAWTSVTALVWWMFRRRKVNSLVKRKMDIFALGIVGAWIPFFVLSVFYAAPLHARWPIDLLAVLFILSILGTYRSVSLYCWLKSLFIVLYAMWGACLIYWQCRVTAFTNYCFEYLKTNDTVAVPDPSDFANVRIPFWLMELTMPQYGAFNSWDHQDIGMCGTDMKWHTYIALPDSLQSKPFSEWPEVSGDNDLRFAGGQLPVRRHDGTKLIGKGLVVEFGRPSIASSPVGLVSSFLQSGESTRQVLLPVLFQEKFVYMGDTLETIHFNRLPRIFKGRDILSISYGPKNL